MLRRITEHIDPGLPHEVALQPRLDAAPRTGHGLPSLRIGRHPNNDVVLTSAGIPLLLSRQHAVITYDGEQFTVVDLDTTNGTYVRPQHARVPAPKPRRLGARSLRAHRLGSRLLGPRTALWARTRREWGLGSARAPLGLWL